MQFLLTLAVVAAVSIAETAPARPIGNAAVRLTLALAAMGAVALFAAIGSHGIAKRLRYQQAPQPELLRHFNMLRAVHAALWLTAAGGILYCLGWTQLVRFDWRLNGVFLADDLLILTPVVLPLVLSWIAFYEVDCCLNAPAGGATCWWAGLRRYLALHARHYLGLLLLPILGLLALQDAARLAWPGLLKSDQAWMLFVPLLALIFVLFPVLLRHVWRTEPLPAGPLRDRLLEISTRWGFAPRQILVWHTDDLVVNAAVAGFVPPLRFVFLTDALLQRFTAEEVAAVFSHEVGHIRHHHLWERLLVMLLPILSWYGGQHVLPQAFAQVTRQIGALGLGALGQTAVLAPLAMVLYALTIFAAYCRKLEFEADLFACRMMAPEGSDTTQTGVDSGITQFVRALEKLALHSAGGRRASAWLHPSVEERVQFLRGVHSNPQALAQFNSRISAMRWTLWSVALLSLAAIAMF